jgi:beta-lactamase regulating signal transducer with metallopeptidase domain
MNLISLLPSELSIRLVLTFGHCLWVGLFIAAAAICVAKLLCGRNPRLCYAVYLGALVLLVAALPVTFVLVGPTPVPHSPPGVVQPVAQSANSTARNATVLFDPQSQPAETAGAPTNFPVADSTASGSPLPVEIAAVFWHRVAEYVSWAYLAGVVLMLARLGVSLSGAQQICRNTIPVESPEVLLLFDKLVRELGLRTAPVLAWSSHIVAPTVIGIIRPAILLPFSLATALRPDELTSILAHELAHIRRYDLWVNLFQRFAEALLFFHPAVWFLSRRLSAEREYCCDDVALSRGLDSMRYGELLVRLAEVRCRVSSAVEQQVALAAAGDRPSQLRRRVARLFGLEEELTMTLTRRGAITLAATFLVVAALFAASVPAEPSNERVGITAESTATLTEDPDARKGQSDSQLSEVERTLVGTWSRVSFLSETKLTFTANRLYRYDYSIEAQQSRTGEIPKGEWRIENGTELVYLRRNADGALEERTRSRIAAVNEKELKLQQLSPAGDGKVYTFQRVAEAETQSTHTAATPPKSEKVTVSGRIVLADGSSATSKGWLYSTTLKGRFYSDTRSKPGAASSKTFATEGQYTDSFSITVPAGTVWLKYFPDDYAPVWSGPFEVEDGAIALVGVTFTLKKGFASTVRLTGDDGQPVARATLIANPEIGGDTNGPVVKLSANEQGQISLTNLAETRYAFRVDAPGYEPLRTPPLKIEPDKTITLTMQRSEPTTGVVRNADGSVAKDAKLLWQYESYPAVPGMGARTYHHSGQVAATTDESGCFTLDELARSAQYLFVVEAADGARLVVPDLQAGQRDVQLQVPLRQDLRVRVVGNLELLQKKSGKLFLSVRQDVELPGYVQYGNVIAGDVFVTPGEEGGSASFQGLIPGRVTVMAGDHQQTFDVAESNVTDVVLTLNSPETSSTVRNESASAPTPATAESMPVPPGKVVEITVNDDNPKVGDCLIDFETGRLFSVPKELREGREGPPPVFEKWIIPNGIDAIGETRSSVRGLFGLDMVAIPIDGPADKLPEISENRLSRQFVEAVPGRPVPISGKGELPATYLFQTREGSRGVLQIVGFEDEPRGVKIRYKLLSSDIAHRD